MVMETQRSRKKVSPILKDFQKKEKLYEDFTDTIEDLVKKLLKEKAFRVLSVTSRTKKMDSLERKILNVAKNYEKLTDIDDLTGIRIICFFSDDVDKVAEIINLDFKVIKDRSVDKREIIEPDRFGYISLHYIAELSDNRAVLPEYQRFKNLRCEIQIRSILQHAWAEIEHDLGYKSSIGIPREVKRKFSRQASLLELADEQFVSIKKDILRYTKETEKKLSQSYKNILIDKISINNYVEKSETIQQIDLKIAETNDLGISDNIQAYTIDHAIQICQYFKIKTIEELDIALRKNEDSIISIAKIMDLDSDIPQGNSIWYLGYVLSAKNGNLDEIENYIESMGISPKNELEDRDEFRSKFAKQIIQALK